MATLNKIYLALLGCLIAAPAWAAAPVSRPLDPIDPSYLPSLNSLVVTTSYSYGESGNETISPSSAVNQENTSQSNHFGESLQFGINDDLSVGMNWGFGNTRSIGIVPSHTVVKHEIIKKKHVTVTQVIPQKQADTVQRGADNPDFSANYRFIDQDPFPVAIDGSFDYSPNVFPARAANKRTTGTEASGTQHGGISLAVSRDITVFDHDATLRASGGVGGESAAVVQGVGGDENLHSGAHVNWSSGVSLYSGITEKLSGVIATTFNGSTNNQWVAVNAPKTPVHINAPGIGENVSAQIGYHIIENRLLLSFQYQHGFGGSAQHFTDSTGSAQILKDSTQGQGSNSYSVHLIITAF